MAENFLVEIIRQNKDDIRRFRLRRHPEQKNNWQETKPAGLR
ncbi:hypothetical protein [Methylovulum sp.]|nr:hypothetical protein [Methylovulum sp.]